MNMTQIYLVEEWHTKLRASPMLSGTGETQGYADATYESAQVALMALDALARSMRRDIDKSTVTEDGSGTVIMEDDENLCAKCKPTEIAPAEQGEEMAKLIALIDKAHDKVVALCHGERWTMHIPAQPDSDPDLVIGEALRSAKKALIAARPQPESAKDVRDLAADIRELQSQYEIGGSWCKLSLDEAAALIQSSFEAWQADEQTALDEPGYWWCPECEEEVTSTRVTFQECHDTCGWHVIWKEPIAARPAPSDEKALREPLRWFAEQMEAKLKENDWKKSWPELPNKQLLDQWDDQGPLLVAAVIEGNPKKIIHRAINIANYAMMLADKTRAILAREAPKEQA